MKNNLILYLILAILTISCTSNDDDEIMSLEERLIEGDWYYKRYVQTCSTGYDLSEGDAYEFRFLTDNTVEFTDPGYLTSSYYELNDNELILETIYTMPQGDKRKFIGNYTYSDNEDSFIGTNEFIAYDETGTLWSCDGTTSIFR